jgi:hypothetical protein
MPHRHHREDHPRAHVLGSVLRWLDHAIPTIATCTSCGGWTGVLAVEDPGLALAAGSPCCCRRERVPLAVGTD